DKNIYFTLKSIFMWRFGFVPCHSRIIIITILAFMSSKEAMPGIKRIVNTEKGPQQLRTSPVKTRTEQRCFIAHLCLSVGGKCGIAKVAKQFYHLSCPSTGIIAKVNNQYFRARSFNGIKNSLIRPLIRPLHKLANA